MDASRRHSIKAMRDSLGIELFDLVTSEVETVSKLVKPGQTVSFVKEPMILLQEPIVASAPSTPRGADSLQHRIAAVEDLIAARADLEQIERALRRLENFDSTTTDPAMIEKVNIMVQEFSHHLLSQGISQEEHLLFSSDEESTHHLKSVMLHASLCTSLISDMLDPEWTAMGLENAAMMLSDVGAYALLIKDPLVSAGVRLARSISEGDTTALREMKNMAAQAKRQDEQHKKDLIQAARAVVSSMSLDDPELNGQARQAVLQIATLMGIKLPDSLPTSQMAVRLLENTATVDQFRSSLLWKQIELAQEMAAGDVCSTRELVAWYLANEEYVEYQFLQQILTSKALLFGKTLENPRFNDQVKWAIMAGLVKVCQIGKVDDPAYQHMTAQEAASMLVQCKDSQPPLEMDDAVANAAILLCGAIADDSVEASHELIARCMALEVCESLR